MESLQINEVQISDLRRSLDFEIFSDKRRQHILNVEKCAIELGKIFLPREIIKLQAAALLHDITKEFSESEQISIISDAKIIVDADTLLTPSVLHSITAPYIVKRDFIEFATDNVLSAIEKHTLGDVKMSVFDKIIFLADFIEETRNYPDSVATRNFVTESMRKDRIDENILILDRACIMEFKSTVAHLSKIGKNINKRSYLAMNSLISKS